MKKPISRILIINDEKLVLTHIAVDATPDHERNFEVGGGGERSHRFFGDLIPHSNVTRRTDSNPGLLP